MLKKYIFLSLSFLNLFGIFLSCEALSNDKNPLRNRPPLNYWDVDFAIYGGHIFGQSHELVFNNIDDPDLPDRVSQLDWRIVNLWVIGGTARANFFEDRLHLTIDGWGKLDANKSTMTDRDYFNVLKPTQPTDISTSSDTKLTRAYALEGQIGYDFFCHTRAQSASTIKTKLGL